MWMSSAHTYEIKTVCEWRAGYMQGEIPIQQESKRETNNKRWERAANFSVKWWNRISVWVHVRCCRFFLSCSSVSLSFHTRSLSILRCTCWFVICDITCCYCRCYCIFLLGWTLKYFICVRVRVRARASKRRKDLSEELHMHTHMCVCVICDINMEKKSKKSERTSERMGTEF